MKEIVYEHSLDLGEDGIASVPTYTFKLHHEDVPRISMQIDDGWQDFTDMLSPTQAREIAAILVDFADAAERGE